MQLHRECNIQFVIQFEFEMSMLFLAIWPCMSHINQAVNTVATVAHYHYIIAIMMKTVSIKLDLLIIVNE